MDAINKLEQEVHLDQGKHRATHHMNGRIFPFMTRNPERVKFKDPFIEIVGLSVRHSLGNELVIEDVKGQYLENIREAITIGETIQESDMRELFSFDFSDSSTPEMLKYYPVSNVDSKETVGKIQLAKYMVELFDLKNNQGWLNYVSQDSKELSLYDQVVNQNLPDLGSQKQNKKENFVFFDQEDLLHYFNRDLEVLMKDQSFFMGNIDQLMSYYLFYYIIQQSLQIDRVERQQPDLWYAFDKEKLSKGRNASRFGYRLVLDKGRNILVHQDLIDYLNTLTGENDQFRSLEEIAQDEEMRKATTGRLVRFNQTFAQVMGRWDDYGAEADFTKQVKQLRDYLEEAIADATVSRYSRSFREFSRLGFIRSRGRLGYVLNASQELILLFVGVIVGQNNKILLDEFFDELAARGIQFDTQSRRAVVEYFEQINILEKLSDSGDAQYVKSIL